jgi:hypothetical protein
MGGEQWWITLNYTNPSSFVHGLKITLDDISLLFFVPGGLGEINGARCLRQSRPVQSRVLKTMQLRRSSQPDLI